MTPAQQEAARRAEVMLAFSRGEAIESSRYNDGGYGPWLTADGDISWNWDDYMYRVKRTPIEVKLRFAYNDGVLLTHCVGFVNSDEVHRRLQAEDRDLILTFREAL